MRVPWLFAVACLFLAVASAALAQDAPPPQEPANPPPAPAPEPAKSKGLEFSVGDWTIRFYGFIRLDAHFDDSHPNNTQLITAIKAEDDDAPAAIREEENAEDFTMHARNTRFGVDVAGPPIPRLWDARAAAKIEFDFLANGGSEAAVISRGLIRMRQAYVQLSWDDFSVLAGQAWDVIAPLNPAIVNGTFIMWGAGNLGDRRPMIRAEYRPALKDGNLILQGAVGLTGAVDGENVDGGTIRDGEASGMPCFQGRLAWKGGVPWLEKKSVEIGGWAYFAEEHLDSQPAGWPADYEDDFQASGGGVDVTLPLLDFLEIRGEAWRGKNLNDVRGGILQGISFGDGGETEVESRGYWGEVLVKAADWITLCAGMSRDNPINSDLTTTVAMSVTGAEDNRTYYAGSRFDAGAGFSFGLEYIHWITKWRGGDFEGTDNRVSFFAVYAF